MASRSCHSFRVVRVPLLDLSEQYRELRDEIRREVDAVLASQHFILGAKGEALERAICELTGARHAIGVSSGTDALLAILMALGIGSGDAVIVPSFTFFATAGCVARLGATPVFADIDEATFNITAETILRCIEQRFSKRGGDWIDRDGNRLRAVVPVHLYGLCCEMDAICDLAKTYGLRVIEDAAQAIGAEYPSREGARHAGTISDVGCFSFYPTKNLGAAGDAGMVVCTDDELATKLRACRQHGMESRYFHDFIGGNFRLDEIQAGILNVKLPHLADWAAARRRIADLYRAELGKRLSRHLSFQSDPYRKRNVTNHHVYHQFVIRTSRRDELREHLTQREIGTAIYYPLGLHEQNCFSYLSYKKGDLPASERAASEVLALPIYPGLSPDAQRYVIDSIAEFFQ